MASVSLSILLSAVGGASVISTIGSISQSLGNGPGGLTGALTMTTAAAVVGLGITAVNAASAFQSSLAKVQAYAGMSQQATEAMGQSILKMAPQLGEAPQALADALYMVASAGFKGADGLTVLKYAGMTAAASNSDATVIAKALVGSLNALGLTASSTGNIQDELNATVKQGLITWDQYGAVVGKLAGSVSAAGGTSKYMQANFTDLNAALDIYTNSGISAHQASMWLNSDMSLLNGKTDTLTKNARSLGLMFNETAFQGMDFAHKIQYLSTVTGGNQQELTKLVNGNSQVAQSVLFLSGHYQQLGDTIKNITGSMQNGKTTQDLFAVAQQTLAFRVQQVKDAFQSLLITIGTMVLPALSNLLGNVAPVVQAISGWMSNIDNARPVLIGLAGAITIVLAPAMWDLAGAVLSAALPFLLLAGAIAGAVAIFQHFYTTNAGFRSFIDGITKGIQQLWQEIQANFLPVVQRAGAWLQTNLLPPLQRLGSFIQTNFLPAMSAIGTWMQKNVLPILQFVGSYIATTFQPVWQNLVDLWNNQLVPLWKQMQPALAQTLPLWQLLGTILGVIVVGALGILVGLITGLAKGIGYMVEGLGTAVGGIMQFFTGLSQVLGGTVQFIVDLIHGKFDKLGGDLGQIWSGIINTFLGLWTTIWGILQAAWGLISGFFGGFVQGIVGFFQTLFDKIVGHSIVPDMVNGIVSWISQLPGRAFAFIESLVSGTLSRFGAFKDKAIAVFLNIVSGIGTAFGNLGNAIWSPIKSALNMAITLINSFIDNLDKLHINLPGGGSFGFSIADIPLLGAGGVVTRAGLAGINEVGAEVVALPAGAAVYPHGSVPAGSQGGVTNIFNIAVSTMARSQSEVSNLVDMIEQELGNRVRLQTNSYSSGVF